MNDAELRALFPELIENPPPSEQHRGGAHVTALRRHINHVRGCTECADAWAVVVFVGGVGSLALAFLVDWLR